MRPITELNVATACNGCPDCCCSQPYDWVHLTTEEARALSAASGVDEAEFVKEKINFATGFRFRILELPCRFLEVATGRCGVYAARPLVCRIYPFHVDPLSGDAMLLAAQCDDRLTVTEEATDKSWSLGGYTDVIREWVRTLWREAQTRDDSSAGVAS